MNNRIKICTFIVYKFYLKRNKKCKQLELASK